MPKKKVTKIEVKDFNLFKDADKLIEQAYYDGVRNTRLLEERKNWILEKKVREKTAIIEEQDELIGEQLDDITDLEERIDLLEVLADTAAIGRFKVEDEIYQLVHERLWLFIIGAALSSIIWAIAFWR